MTRPNDTHATHITSQGGKIAKHTSRHPAYRREDPELVKIMLRLAREDRAETEQHTKRKEQ
ncbi:hypothetical protein [Bifidobacterium scaligerum]|uniref:Uncharacterized protein n=1 Tax=Bifidobacterium scaligerum TaxID=2052656 RepID=A0A2M9HT37_9BIFI|nr:hypothetical protein [Bifidobacterium scaligerum]PJM79986.1 hypothetical protein CUU80_02300 [Bifidobacterium scaligerum]